MPTPTEWYTSLPGVDPVRAPENRGGAGGGAGGGGFPRSPLDSNFHKERRALQNALAKKQLELMEQKLKQAREDSLQQREARLLAPSRRDTLERTRRGHPGRRRRGRTTALPRRRSSI